MKEGIVAKAYKFVAELFEKELSEGMLFHDFKHTLDVWKGAKTITAAENVNEQDTELIELAALFHDTGYVKVYNGHEEASVEFAKEFLVGQNYPGEKIAKIAELILATRMNSKPVTAFEKILKDADMCHIAQKKYSTRAACLRKEWELFLGKKFTDKEWQELNIKFLEENSFYTDSAKKKWDKMKAKNLKKMKKDSKASEKEMGALANSKSAQMAFKTALRNHIDLTALADNKANIMLSINAILITISIPYLPGYISANQYLLIPTILLILTNIGSVVTATLATRPIAMKGHSKSEHIRTGAANLFFFGNFYKMKKEEYVEAISGVINSDNILEKSVISDLYHLGVSLGDKYKVLRLCYTIFMVGMSLTVIAALAVFMFT